MSEGSVRTLLEPLHKENDTFSPLQTHNSLFNPLQINNDHFRPLQTENESYEPIQTHNDEVDPIHRDTESMGASLQIQPMGVGNSLQLPVIRNKMPSVIHRGDVW